MRFKLQRPSPAMVVALAALVFAVTQGASANLLTIGATPVVGIHVQTIVHDGTIAPDEVLQSSPECPKGWFALNGGADISSTGGAILASHVSQNLQAWDITLFNAPLAKSADVQSEVECAQFIHEQAPKK